MVFDNMQTFLHHCLSLNSLARIPLISSSFTLKVPLKLSPVNLFFFFLISLFSSPSKKCKDFFPYFSQGVWDPGKWKLWFFFLPANKSLCKMGKCVCVHTYVYVSCGYSCVWKHLSARLVKMSRDKTEVIHISVWWSNKYLQIVFRLLEIVRKFLEWSWKE